MTAVVLLLLWFGTLLTKPHLEIEQAPTRCSATLSRLVKAFANREVPSSHSTTKKTVSFSRIPTHTPHRAPTHKRTNGSDAPSVYACMYLFYVCMLVMVGSGGAEANQQGRNHRAAVVRRDLQQDGLPTRDDEPQKVCRRSNRDHTGGGRAPTVPVCSVFLSRAGFSSTPHPREQ